MYVMHSAANMYFHHVRSMAEGKIIFLSKPGCLSFWAEYCFPKRMSVFSSCLYYSFKLFWRLIHRKCKSGRHRIFLSTVFFWRELAHMPHPNPVFKKVLEEIISQDRARRVYFLEVFTRYDTVYILHILKQNSLRQTLDGYNYFNRQIENNLYTHVPYSGWVRHKE